MHLFLICVFDTWALLLGLYGRYFYIVVHQYAYTNSGLYVGYAHMFGLPYWAVVSAHGSGQYIIDPADVVLTVRAALGDVSATTIDRLIADAPVYQVHGCQDSLNCFEGCCHFPCCPTGLLERTSPWHGSRAPGTVSHKGGFLQPRDSPTRAGW